MRAPEEAYNAKSRRIEWKLDIFFNGAYQDPVSIVRDNFLVSAEVLEETNASSNTPWGNVSANELTAVIRNENDIFNPTNSAGPYYNKIKVGVMIKAFVRPVPNDRDDVARHEELEQYTHEFLAEHTHDEIHHMGQTDPEYDWDPIGVFYLADWITRSGGLTAEVAAYDKISDVLGAAKVKMKVLRNITKKDFIQTFFDTLNTPIVIDSALLDSLPFGYHVKTNKDFLNNVSAGMNAWIFCDHYGQIHARYMRHRLQAVYTITDDDQIVDISSQQGIVTNYDGIQLYLKVPQLSESQEVLAVRNLVIPFDKLEVVSQVFSKQPVADVLYAKLTKQFKAMVTWHNATAIDLNYKVSNQDRTEFSSSLSFFGRVVETADTVLSNEGNNLLKLDNIYVQTQEQFDSIKRFLYAWISGIPPLIEITVRGNPQFELGQKIHVESTRFNTVFDGVLIRQKLHYDGGMTGTITLMNSRILEVV